MGIRKTLLAGAALGCLLCGTDAWAGGPSGNYSALGMLNPGSLNQLTQAVTGPQGLVLDAPANSNGNGNKVNPFYGAINPFYGHINPFYGAINPFYGNVSPFWGNISPFWGNINPFYGSISPFYGNVNPFWGTSNPFDPSVGTFWQQAGPEWGAINTTWNNLQASGATDYSGLQAQLKSFLAENANYWNAAVLKYTGKDFNGGFADAMLAKYGINPDDPSSLANADAVDRSAFFLNWYDGLMNYTGVDHVDWWMSAVNWSPALANIQGSMTQPIVGILDSTFTATNVDVTNLKFVGGYNYYVNQHGGAVASLIASAQDGTGTMGVDPNVDIHLYNPFDTTGTASWNDVALGINHLFQTGAHVVNASLGVPGTVLSQEWVNILTGPLLSNRGQDLVVVKAAGNEGVAQTADVAWSSTLQVPQNLILVGSVGPTGQISSFSNTPGNACFTILGICTEQNKLMYRFIVAPGENILVSDGNGGVTRMSGTSFAAPLVTGAIALLYARWPWLEQHAPETVQIILQSAKDLGAPGVDPIYGWGELDIQASQSPLNFNNLVVYQPFNYNGQALNPIQTTLPNWSARSLKQSVLMPGQLDLWQNQKAYLVALEPIGTTFRDFTIPLSTMLVGKNQKTAYGNNPFQSYLYQRLIDWSHGSNLTNFTSQNAVLDHSDWDMSLTETDPLPEEQRVTGVSREHYEMALSNPRAGIDFRLGEGSGAHGLTSGLTSQNGLGSAFSLETDFDLQTGGVNPVLGLASGSVYAQAGMTFDGLHVSAGYTEKRDDHVFIDPTFGPQMSVPLPANRAAASVLGVDYALTKNLGLNVSYTSLDEYDGFLGAQGGGVLSFGKGARTNALTVGGTAALDGGWSLAVSATAGNTVPGATQSALTFTSHNMRSDAYEFVATKKGVFGDDDTLRFSVAQPLHLENGGLKFQSLEVIDRDTGQLGPVTQNWSMTSAREQRIEAIYAVPVLDNTAELSGFGLFDMNALDSHGQTDSVSAGMQIKIAY